MIPRPRIGVALLLLSLAAVLACAKKSTKPPPVASSGPPRTYRMGFSNFPPKLTQQAVDANLAAWLPRGDQGLLHVSPEWAALIAGIDADTIVLALHAPVAAYYRSRGLTVTLTLDATDGLDRSAEAPALITAGRSLTEPAIRQLYRDYALAMWKHLHPEHLSLAAETNLIRLVAPAPLYAAVRQVANDAAADLRAAGCTAKLSVSLQNEVLWGRDQGGVYRGPAADLADFPFLEEVPLSSYPYLGGFAAPEDVPLDYYARIAADAGMPVRIVEGGWASETVSGIVSSPAEQARYLRRQFALLDSARANGVFQISFADFDLTSLPSPPPNLALFTSIGLADTVLRPKPALAPWDSAFARPLQ